MAPKPRLETIVQIANPFDLPVYKLKESFEEPSAVYYQGSSGQQEVADEDEDEPSVRITTRARFTYELDRFNKNLMLIINNNITDLRSIYLMEAFYKHKFEFTLIETDQEGDENEIWNKIDQFFQRDFSDIGAVAVSTALSTPDTGSSTVNRIKEWDVLTYYMENQPASLQGKPKIFMSESPEPTTLPFTSLPTDTLLIQTHVDDVGKRPLILLCSKLISMEGTCDILDILSEVNQVANEETSFPNDPVTCLSTMSKELLLKKTVPEPEAEFESEWEEEFESRIMSDPNLFEIYARLFKITLPVPEAPITESPQVDGYVSEPSTSGSQNDTTEDNYTTNQNGIILVNSIDQNYTTEHNDNTDQNDTADQNDITEQNDAIEHNDTTAQNNTTDQNDTSEHNDTADQNDITEQNDAIEHNVTTAQNDTTDQNDTSEHNDTADQNDITEQNDATEHNDTTPQNDTTDQNDTSEHNDTADQNDITEQNDATEHNDTTVQNDTSEQNDTIGQNCTTVQNDAIGQNCTTVQNDTTDQNDTRDQNLLYH